VILLPVLSLRPLPQYERASNTTSIDFEVPADGSGQYQQNRHNFDEAGLGGHAWGQVFLESTCMYLLAALPPAWLPGLQPSIKSKGQSDLSGATNDEATKDRSLLVPLRFACIACRAPSSY